MNRKHLSLFVAVLAIMYFVSVSFAASYAERVVDYSTSAANSDGISSILGAPDGLFATFTGETLDTGEQGFATIAFDSTWIIDGPGDDLQITLYDWNLGEGFDLYVSADHISYTHLATEMPDAHYSEAYVVRRYDLADVSLDAIQYLRLVNSAPRTSGKGNEGAEFDAIEALNTGMPPSPAPAPLAALVAPMLWILSRRHRA